MNTLKSRFESKVIKGADHECWSWIGARNRDGYGQLWDGTKRESGSLRIIGAHQASYLLAHGHLPEGKDLDHICRNRSCVNPLHLEPVTHNENMRRSPISLLTIFSSKTHCPKGHSYEGDNLYIRRKRDGSLNRVCKACRNAASKECKRRKRRSLGMKQNKRTLQAL